MPGRKNWKGGLRKRVASRVKKAAGTRGQRGSTATRGLKGVRNKLRKRNVARMKSYGGTRGNRKTGGPLSGLRRKRGGF